MWKERSTIGINYLDRFSISFKSRLKIQQKVETESWYASILGFTGKWLELQ